jgi:cellulose synthase/poly-beta-1,6-N-acetylglucosamine synthase-like glycosyltransferase
VRFGYHTTVVASTTYEEAPARFGPWLRQRTRWFKGWMQIVKDPKHSSIINILIKISRWQFLASQRHRNNHFLVEFGRPAFSSPPCLHRYFRLVCVGFEDTDVLSLDRRLMEKFKPEAVRLIKDRGAYRMCRLA